MAKRIFSLNFRKAVSVLLASSMMFSAIAPVMAEDMQKEEVRETEAKVQQTEPVRNEAEEVHQDQPAQDQPVQEPAPQEAGTEDSGEKVAENPDAPAKKDNKEAKPAGGEEDKYMLLLPQFWDGISYSIAEDHKSGDLSDSDYIVLLYKENESVQFTASPGNYQGTVIDAKTCDIDHPLYSQKEDGSFSFNMPKKDVMFYASPVEKSVPKPEQAEEPKETEMKEPEAGTEAVSEDGSDEAPDEEEEEDGEDDEDAEPGQEDSASDYVLAPDLDNVESDLNNTDSDDGNVENVENIENVESGIDDVTGNGGWESVDEAPAETEAEENITEVPETEPAVAEETEEVQEVEDVAKADDGAETDPESNDSMSYLGDDIPVIDIDDNEDETEIDVSDFIDEYEKSIKYPEKGSIEKRSLSFWIKDTDLDFTKPDLYTDKVEVTLKEGSEVPSFETLNVGDSFTLSYTARLIEEEDYEWTIEVTFTAVNTLEDADMQSEDAGAILPDWIPQDGSELPLPKRAGETLTGFTYNVVKGDESFNINTLKNGYDPQKFRLMLADNGGFDVNTVGTYQVTYDVAYFLAENYVWHVVSTVNVVENTSVNRINVKSDTIKVSITHEDGSDEAVRYQDAYSTEERSFILTIWPNNKNILTGIEPEVTVLNEEEEDISGETVEMTGADEENYIYSFQITLPEGKNRVTIKDLANALIGDEIKGYSGGFRDIDEDYVSGINEDEFASYEGYLATHNLDYETGEYEPTVYDENGDDASGTSDAMVDEEVIGLANSDNAKKENLKDTGWKSIKNAMTITVKFWIHTDNDGVTDKRFSGLLCKMKSGTYNYLVSTIKALDPDAVTDKMKAKLLADLKEARDFAVKNTSRDKADKKWKIFAPVCKTSTVTIGGKKIKHKGYGWPIDDPFPIYLCYRIKTWQDGNKLHVSMDMDTVANPKHAKKGGRVRQTFSANGKPISAEDKVQTTKVKVKKVNAVKAFRGLPAYSDLTAEFTVYDKDNKKVGVLKTDDKGNSVNTLEVYIGEKYTIKETVVPPNFKKMADQKVTIDNPAGKTFTFEDEPLYSNIVLKKAKSHAGDLGNLEGATYQVDYYTGPDCTGTNTVSWQLRTDKDGYAYNTKDYLVKVVHGERWGDDIVPFGSVKVTEIQAPNNNKFAVNNTPAMQTIDEPITYRIEGSAMTDAPAWAGFEALKIDGSIANGSAILPGTKFDLIVNDDQGVMRFDKYDNGNGPKYGKGAVIGKLVADSSGKISTANMLDEKGNALPDTNNGKCLQNGSYLIRETEAHYGMVLQAGNWGITLSDTSGNGPIDTYYIGNPLKNMPQYGRVTVEKIDKETQKKVAGAKFSIYARKDIYNVVDKNGNPYPYSVKIHSADPNRENPLDTITTGADGTATSKDLYIGSYYIVEESSPEGYVTNKEEQDFTFTYNGQTEKLTTAHVKVEDDVTHMELYKLDAETKEPVQGITFKLTLAGEIKSGRADNPNAIDGGTFVTDENGLITAKYLKTGIYKIQEILTIPGYAVDTKVRYLTVDKDGYIYESGAQGEMLDNREVSIPSSDSFKEETFPVNTDEMTDAEAVENAMKRIGPNPKGTEEDYDITQPVTNEEESNYAKLTWYDRPIVWDFSKKDVNGDEEIEGAQMEIVDEFGAVFESWTSGKEPHRVTGMPVGEYFLVEKVAVKGYAVATRIPFTVTDTAVIQHLTMLDKQHFVHKSDITGEPEIPGATLYVVDKETGEQVDRWVSGTTPHPLSNIVVGKTYILHEEVPAEGYCIASEVEFSVDDNFKTGMTTMHDKQVLVYKEDVAGKEIPGASLTITDKDTGTEMDSWISTEEPHPVKNLQVGKTYILKEVLAPEGYALANEVEFTVQDDFNIQHVEMVDKQVFITKTDLTNGDELPGAELEVKDDQGTVVDSWISTEEPHPVKNLKVGYTYVLTEKKPADGYTTAESITFTVNDDFKVDHYKMEDDVTKVSISKIDITNKKELPGAKLKIKDSEGNTVESWTSTKEPHMIYKLPVGKYTLIEVTAPNGYEKAEKVKFEVTDSNEIHKVVMKDAPIKKENKVEKPKTGDTFPFLPTVLGFGAVILLLAVYFVLRRDKKKSI